MKRVGLLLVLLALLPATASAWWNDDWGYKKKISLDMKKLQQDGLSIPDDAFALVRLHTGNFSYFLDLADQGKDIRVLAEDEKTPLKFFIEKLDPANDMALIWVKLPKDLAKSQEPAIWLYYGNPGAVDAQDANSTFDVVQVLDYPFQSSGFRDATANANHPAEATASSEGGLIAGAAAFQGNQIIRIPSSPTLSMNPTTGWTVAMWLKCAQAHQQNSVLFQRTGTAGTVTLAVREQTPYLEITNASGVKQEFSAQFTVAADAWHHLALAVTTDRFTIYIDGTIAGSFPVSLAELTGDITIGADATGGRGFSGLIDQFAVFKNTRDVNAIKFDVAMQGAGAGLLIYGEDATPDAEGGESYILATLDNVTIDGWVIIGILGVMFAISWMVMITKAIVINRIHKDNRRFEQVFSQLGAQDLSALNVEENEDDQDFEESPLLLSLTSSHGAYAGSSIYRIYHVGVEEMNKRLNKQMTQTLTASAMAAVKASMDAVVVRELQKLNSQMVLLTIAISGGPFLGLLGTVVGVMITFAAIAVSGEVNVNAIAPGIAAALTATVAGLAVAIPALFGYNYLGSRIKVITADMQVFVDEFVAKLTEQHT